MKVNIDGIDVEGTPQEVAEIIKAMRSNTTSIDTTVTSKTTFSTPPSNAVEDFLPHDEEFNKFIKNLYRYKPDKFAKNGKAPYVVQLLRSGQWFTVKQLMRLSAATQNVVSGAIRRAADAGCVIETTSTSSFLTSNTRVRMISLGTVEQAKAVRDSFAPSVTMKQPQPRVFKTPIVPKSTTEQQLTNLLNSKKTND